MTQTWPFYHLLPGIPPFYRSEALARIPTSFYNTLTLKEPTIPWILVDLFDKRLLCRAVPSVNELVEYVEATSNLWIPKSDNAKIDSNVCSLSGLLKRPKYAEIVEIEGEAIDNFELVMRAFLVHKPICKGLNLNVKYIDEDATEECERLFKVKSFKCQGDGEEFALVAPQTVFKLVSLESRSKNDSIKCPPGLEGPFSQISDLLDPRILKQMIAINVTLPRGVLMSGPPGVGKTYLVRYISENSGIPLKVVNGPELLSPIPGESESNLLQVFEDAKSLAKGNEMKCSIIFFDEIDAIARKREVDNMESLSEVRLLTQLLTLMDGHDSFNFEGCHVMIFAATNRPNSLDPAMRRPGRFDREVLFEPPDAATRSIILKSLLKDYVEEEFKDVDFDEIGRSCVGYVSADLAALAQEVCISIANDVNDDADLEDERAKIGMKERFVEAMKQVGPSLHRQYQVALDNRVTWKDVAGIDEIRDELKRYIEWPLLHPEAYERMGLVPPRGVLLYGPPGCSKTTIAKAIANESGFTFYSLNGAALYSCFVGESEQQIRDIFLCARMTSPSVIFFDEIDAIVGKRSSEFGVSSGGDSVQERVLSTLLNEMDGISVAKKRNVLVVGATNRKDLIDEALLRPGRFDKHIYIPLPTEKGRLEILELFMKGKDADSTVDLSELAAKTDKFSGADLKGLIQEAAILAMHDETFVLSMDHFRKVLESPGRRRCG